MYEITLNEKHEYFVNGVKKPSVTQIIDAVLYEKNKEFYTEEASIRGTYIHLACEYYDKNILADDSVDEKIKPYLNAYQKFRLEYPYFKLLEVELKIYNDIFGYCGTLDRIFFDERNSCYCFLDLKSGQQTDRTRIQLAGYSLELVNKYSNYAHKNYGLYLQDNGTYKLKEYESREAIKVFLNARSIYKFKEDNKLW